MSGYQGPGIRVPVSESGPHISFGFLFAQVFHDLLLAPLALLCGLIGRASAATWTRTSVSGYSAIDLDFLIHGRVQAEQ